MAHINLLVVLRSIPGVSIFAALLLAGCAGGKLDCTFQALAERGEVVVVGSGVSNPGVFSVPEDASLRSLLNLAECHRCTSLRRVRVHREIDGQLFRLEVSNNPPKGSHREPFKVMAGDMISVPCRMLDPADHDIPVEVTAEFYMVSKTNRSNPPEANTPRS